MPRGLSELQPGDMSPNLESVLLPRLAKLLRTRQKGHCMRVSDLDNGLMTRLCERLRQEVPDSQVYILRATDGPAHPPELYASSTKLVELRNPGPDGSLRTPLLVFLPANLRSSAEDSFGVATFEEVDLGDVYAAVTASLRETLPASVRAGAAEVLDFLKDERWRWAAPLATARYLRTVHKNGTDAEAVGAALYELGLVPDFRLLEEPAALLNKVRRNRDCVEKLTNSSRSERGRVIDLKLKSADLRARLGEFLTIVGLEDPPSWCRKIVLDSANWPLSFDKWEPEDTTATDSVCVEVLGNDVATLPDQGEGSPAQAIAGQPCLILGSKGTASFSVTFRVTPHPSQINGLDRFEVQIVSQDRGLTGVRKVQRPWKKRADETAVTFTKANKLPLEEGWHFIRVRALTADGDFLPLVDREGRPIAAIDLNRDDEEGRRPNEGELFYVLPEGEAEAVQPTRAAPRHASLEHARLHLQLAGLQESGKLEELKAEAVRWTDPPARKARESEAEIEVRFSPSGVVRIPVPGLLKEIETRLLGSPDRPVCLRLTARSGVADPAVVEPLELSRDAATEAFLVARQEFFRAVARGDSGLTAEAADFRDLLPSVMEYASRYKELVDGLLGRVEAASGSALTQAVAELNRVLAIDSVYIVLAGHQAGPREAVLLSPLHPLRALWIATWTQVARNWCEQLQRADREARQRYLDATRTGLLEDMVPLHFPAVLPLRNGRLFAAVESIHPFWAVYAPVREEDLRGLVSEVCETLRLDEPTMRGSRLAPKLVAARFHRYLVQHPYVHTLTLNVFNPGSGHLVANLLLELQKNAAYAGLHFDVRLFAKDTATPGLGEALQQFLAPAGGGRGADAFAILSGNHLAPKLALALRNVEDFRARPAGYPAHISLLFDVFPPEEVSAGATCSTPPAGSVHGLFQDFHAEYQDDDAGVVWKRRPCHAPVRPLEPHKELTALLGELPSLLSTAASVVATGKPMASAVPVVSLSLGPAERAFLHQVHEVSDWVFTIDRNLGIEFFDHRGRPDRPDYLIDHSPEMVSPQGQRLVITSRSLAELVAIFRPVLQEYELPADERHALGMLHHLRSLSGRLALKLISAPTQRAEALGLALARTYLEQQGSFRNQLVVPLDAHLDLYPHGDRDGDALGEEVSFKRTDLALFDLDASARVITCSLVEVKCLRHVGEAQAYRQLRDRITAQVGQSELVLRAHFDPLAYPVDRPDRLLKSRELAELLGFYLARSARYGMIDSGVETEARYFLATLEQGYQLRFRRSAIVFDFDRPGSEPPDEEGGIEYHRVGVDLIRNMVRTVQVPDSAVAQPTAHPSEGLPTLDNLANLGEPVPRLAVAAFIAPHRDHGTTQEPIDQNPPPAEDEEGGGNTSSTPPPRQPGPVGGIVPPSIDQNSDHEERVAAASGKPVCDPSPAPLTSSEDKEYAVLLGAVGVSPQYGILGDVAGRKVAIDLNQTHTISLFGVQGGGKSYTLGTIVEMACLQIPHINRLPRPLAAVIFHYSSTQDYKPEFTSMVEANSAADQLQSLALRYGALPCPLTDVVLLAPRDKVETRRIEYPRLEVQPLIFGTGELQASHWRFLMGAVGSQSLYFRQLNAIMRSQRGNLTVAGLTEEIARSSLADHLKQLARTRLDLAGQYVADSGQIASLVRPGRLLIVDLRDEFIDKDEALGLFVVLLQLIADARHDGQQFNKLVVFDEAHKYIENHDLIAGLVEVVREMRHKGTSILVASQDPLSVPVQLIELSSQIILHKFNSPAWLKHVQKANSALGNLTPEKIAQLGQGEAFVWSSKATDASFCSGAVKVRCRPRVTQHGGETRTAVK